MQLFAPLDALRRGAMAAVLARPRARAWLTRRDARLRALALAGVAFSLGLACVAPAAALVLAPIVLGVPHVASDARYLVLRRGLPAHVVAAVVVGCAAMLGLRVAEGLVENPAPFAGYELAAAAAWAALLAALGGAARGAWRRAGLVAIAALVVGRLALAAPEHARIVLAHGHNLVGVALWAIFFRRARGVVLPVALALAAATLVAATGAPLRLAHALGTDVALGMSTGDAAATLAPGFGAAAARGLVASFVLLQGVHYAAWLGWIPQDDVRGQGTLTFAMTARGLLKDFRPFGLVALGLTWAAVVLGALVSARGARDTYLMLASFHAYLELAMLAYFAAAGGFGATRAKPT